jgi:hypothetical protein
MKIEELGNRIQEFGSWRQEQGTEGSVRGALSLRPYSWIGFRPAIAE